LVGVAVIGSSVYSAGLDGGHGVAVAVQARVGSERVTFQGVVPNIAGPGMPWFLDQLIHQVQTPGWNGVLEIQGPHNLNMLTAAELRTLGERIQELPILAGRQVVFAAAVPVDAMRQEVRIAQLDATLMRPFSDGRIPRDVIARIFEIPFGRAIAEGAKRNLQVGPGLTLGKAWSILGEVIKYHSCGIQEAVLLMENAYGLNPNLKNASRRVFAATERASSLWNAMNVEFEKDVAQRNRDNVERAGAELQELLAEISCIFGYAEVRFRAEQLYIDWEYKVREGQTPLDELMTFLTHQPGDRVFEAFMQCRGGFPVDAAHHAAAPEKTTSEMLDDLLTTKPNKDIAAAVEGAAPGLTKTIRLGGDRLWNVHKLDDPQAAKWQENASNRGWNGQYGNGMWNQNQDFQFNQEVVAPCEAKFRTIVESLNLQDGSYTMLVRVPAGGSHQFRILGFKVGHEQAWGPMGPRSELRVTLEKHIGLVEITEAKDGDEKVPMYDPLRVHGVNSIQGTMMAQRVHAAMAEHRVHQFWKLPENVRVHLRGQVEAYTDQLNVNRLENQRLHQYAPTRDEVKLPADALQERMHAYTMSRVHQGAAYGERLHALAQSKAAKLSAELKDRFAADRALRMRTHGDDLRNNPSQQMQDRVHNLFDRVHDKREIMNQLTPREKEFYRDNKPGGYVDTVERAVAAQQAPFDSRSGPARVHYEVVHGARLHAERLHGGNYAVAVSAPGAQYGKISEALGDYDRGGNGYEEERLHGGRIHAERLHGGNHAVAVSAPVAQYGNILYALDDGEVEVGRSAFFGNASVSASLSQHGAGGSRPFSREYYEAKGNEK